MTKDEFHELIMGAVLIAAGYALYVHFKKVQVPTTGATPVVVPVVPQTAVQQPTLKTVGLNTLQNLLDGTVNNIIGGSDGESWY